MGFIHFWIENKISDLKTESAYTHGQLNKIASLGKRIHMIETLQKNTMRDIQLIGEFVKILPEGIYFTLLKREGTKIILHGKGESNTHLSLLMRQIEKSHLLSQPELAEIKTTLSEIRFIHAFSLNTQQK